MLDEHMIDLEGGYGEMWSRSWRCFNCGHRDDAVLRHHRQAHAKPIVVSRQALPQETVEEAEFVEPLAA
jgi:hypothetical protein